MLNIGIDVHKKICVAAIKGESREMLEQIDFENTTEGISKFIRHVRDRYDDPVRAACESTGNYWIRMHDLLDAAGIDTPMLHCHIQEAPVAGRQERSVFTVTGNGAMPVSFAVDSTGFKQHNRGEWIRQKWKVRRGFVKLHVLVDTDTKRILAFQITDDRTGDSPMLIPLLDEALDAAGREGGGPDPAPDAAPCLYGDAALCFSKFKSDMAADAFNDWFHAGSACLCWKKFREKTRGNIPLN